MTIEREVTRLQYKPEVVSVLLVGESLSTSGTFFYNADSNLYRYTQEAFSILFGHKCGRDQEFLRFFKKHGFYLDDLCSEPVNHLPKALRVAKRLEGIASLSSRIRKMQLLRVIALMKKIESQVREGVRLGNLSVAMFSVPFPAHGNQRRYVSELSELLRRFVVEGIISTS